MAHLFFHLTKTFGRKKTLALLRHIAPPPHPHAPPTNEPINWSTVQDAYLQLLEAELEEKPDTLRVPFPSVLEGKSPHAASVEKLKAYHERLGTSLKDSKLGHAFFNGKPYLFDNVSFDSELGNGKLKTSNDAL